jgi:hypothetical protein
MATTGPSFSALENLLRITAGNTILTKILSSGLWAAGFLDIWILDLLPVDI